MKKEVLINIGSIFVTKVNVESTEKENNSQISKK